MRLAVVRAGDARQRYNFFVIRFPVPRFSVAVCIGGSGILNVGSVPFTNAGTLAPGDVGTWLLHVGSDSLQVEYVPEPATLCLVAAGGLATFFRRRRSGR